MEVSLKIKSMMSNYLFAILLIVPNLCESQIMWEIDTLMKSETVLFMESDNFFNYLLHRKEPSKNLSLSEKEIDFSLPFEDLVHNNSFIIIQFLMPQEFWVFQEQKMIYQGEGSLKTPEGRQIYFTDFERVEGKIHSGKINGNRITYSIKNDTILHQEYENGKLNGIVKRVDENGFIRYFCRYKKGKKNGLEFELFEDGMLRFSRYYEDGVKVDCHKCIFDGDGNVIKNCK